MENIKLYAFADEASKDLSLQIAAMKRNNLNGLEIRNVDGQSIIDVTNEKARQIRRDMDAAGLQVYTIGSPVGKIDIETGDWETHKEKFKHLLEVTEILGAENMRIFSFFIPKGKDPENYRNEVIDRLGWLLEQAVEYVKGMTAEEVAGIQIDEATKPVDVDLASSVTISIYGFLALIAKVCA